MDFAIDSVEEGHLDSNDLIRGIGDFYSVVLLCNGEHSRDLQPFLKLLGRFVFFLAGANFGMDDQLRSKNLS